MRKPLVIAHRGDSSHALENSLAAFRRALDLGVDMIELDVRKSRDGALYVMHDKETGRTADRNIDIEKSASADISRVRLRNGEPIPALEDAFKLVAGKAGINIEIKSAGAGAALSRFLFYYRYAGYVMVSSFKEREVLSARGVNLDLPVSLIFDTFFPHHVSAYRAKGYSYISLRRTTVTEKLVTACHKHGIKVYVWTVDDEEEMSKLISWGVEGIYTNQPAVLMKLLEKR